MPKPPKDPVQAAQALLASGWSKEDVEAVLGTKVLSCYNCGKAATKLCDGLKLPEGTPTPARIADYVTCDKPMCETCSTHAGRGLTFYCSRRDGLHVDTFDLCWDCYFADMKQSNRRRSRGIPPKMPQRWKNKPIK